MRIAEASDRTGIPARMLRYYEGQGLLSPKRDGSGYRDYTEEDIAAAKRIRYFLDAGLSTATIATVLPCLEDRVGAPVPTCPDVIADLQRERDRIVGAIDALTASRAAIESVIHAGKTLGGSPAGR